MRDSEYNTVHISSGGIIYRIRNQQLEFLLLWRKTGDTWHLPKGTLEHKENTQETALREVLEETGFAVTIDAFLGILPSTFFKGKQKVDKLTFYYLMQALENQQVLPHDKE